MILFLPLVSLLTFTDIRGEAPWVFSPETGGWVYLPEEVELKQAEWGYFHRPRNLDLPMTIDGRTFVTESNRRATASMLSYDLLGRITFNDVYFGQDLPEFLSFTVTHDVREDVTVGLIVDGEELATVDASYASAMQRIRIPLEPEVAQKIQNVGRFDLKATANLWVAAPNDRYPMLGIGFYDQDEPARPLERLKDSALTQFGWMFGCVLDGLYELYQQTGDSSYLEALEMQLGEFLSPQGVNYESPSNVVYSNQFSSIELTLPIAVITKLYPDNPSVEAALQFLNGRTDANGLVTDGWATTTEGCYTIAYPLMVIARERGDETLARKALDQLDKRRAELWVNNSLYLRNNDGYRTYRHWARGICWYFLGHVRTLIANGLEPSEDHKAHLAAVAEYVDSYQAESGMWLNFINNIHQLPDTSGTSGIACALALAAHRGWIDPSYLDNAESAYAALGSYFVDGGFLDSVAPNNKRGETAQMANIRTCEPFALGLYGQLHAALLEAGRLE